MFKANALLKRAQEFEEAIPITQPSGFLPHKDQTITVPIEDQLTVPHLSPAERHAFTPFLRKSLYKFEQLASLCLGAANILKNGLKTGEADLVFHPRIGIRTGYLDQINAELKILNRMFDIPK